MQVRCHCIEQHAPPSELTDEQQQHSPILILFSGGVDSTLLAALAHEVCAIALYSCVHMCLSFAFYYMCV